MYMIQHWSRDQEKEATWDNIGFCLVQQAQKGDAEHEMTYKSLLYKYLLLPGSSYETDGIEYKGEIQLIESYWHWKVEEGHATWSMA